MAIIDDVAWSVKETKFEEYSKFIMGKIGPKAVRSPKYMNETNFFLQPKCKLGEFYSVIIIFLMGFTKSGSCTIWIFPSN